MKNAGVTQLVESQPSKLLVAGSSPVSRSGHSESRFSGMKNLKMDSSLAALAQNVWLLA